MGFKPGAKLKYMALGQGMGPKAAEFIEMGVTRGLWIMLQVGRVDGLCAAGIWFLWQVVRHASTRGRWMIIKALWRVLRAPWNACWGLFMPRLPPAPVLA
jgi:hypothetical protein